MKYITTKKSILSKIALIALISVTGSYTYASHYCEINKNRIEHVSDTFTSVEEFLAQFVDSKNNTAFNLFVLKLKTTLEGLQRDIETVTRSHHDDLTKEIDELMDYSLQQFNILYNVFKKYNGKPDSQAVVFGEEIKREFNTEKIFSEMINKLKTLRGKAANAGDKHLVKQIEDLAKKIQQKKNLWTAKSNLSLITGLMHRMRCR